MIQSVFGTKIAQAQAFLEDGTRIPVTIVKVADLPVVQVKTTALDGYSAIQVGIGVANVKKVKKAIASHVKKANIAILPYELREIRLSSEEDMPSIGEFVRVSDVLRPGDTVDITGFSKGKGFAGGVKRHHFKGGPRTHGQSDRERAPGSLGQTTTPGRVYKGKRMAGHMGQENVTIQNLLVVDVQGDRVFVKGLLPGVLTSVIGITKTGESKKFVPLLKANGAEEILEKVEEPVVEAPVEVSVAQTEKVEEVNKEAKIEEAKE
jgi:large subunit ribosomal protein L3